MHENPHPSRESHSPVNSALEDIFDSASFTQSSTQPPAFPMPAMSSLNNSAPVFSQTSLPLLLPLHSSPSTKLSLTTPQEGPEALVASIILTLLFSDSCALSGAC